MNKLGKIAISEILILIIGTIAFAYIAGIGSLGLVSARVGARCEHSVDCGSNEECSGGVCVEKEPDMDLGGMLQLGGSALAFKGQIGEKAAAVKPVTPTSAATASGVSADLFKTQYSAGTQITFKMRQGPETWTLGTDNQWHRGEEVLGSGGLSDRYSLVEGTVTKASPSTMTAAQGWQAVGKGVLWGIGVGLAVYFLAPMFGASEQQAKALAISLGAGVAVGKSLANLGVAGKTGWAFSPTGAFVIGAGVAVVLFLVLYKKEGTRDVKYNCEIWDAPTGGSNCEKCNQYKDFPCSEYQCKSLGQACQLLNQGTKQEKCAWVNPRDVVAPIVNTWTIPLTTGYRYTPDNATNPPDRGVKIIASTSDECVPAFTPLVFGIQTNEPAKCKIDTLRKNFTEMEYFFGGSSLFSYNHTQTMAMPGVANAQQEGANITLENNGEASLYVRCVDANNNSNDADLVFKFCVAKGPDTTAPVIVDTSVINNMPVAVGQDEINLDVYLNEPSECKWSSMDREYEQMETVMDCSKADSIADAVSVNSRLVYTCKTKLTGIKDKFENKFYFRCKDQPKASVNGTRNTNAQSYVFTVFGTETLVIDEAGPNKTVRDSTSAVKVTLTAKTSGGFKEGESICYFRERDETDSAYVEFFNTASYTHSTDLFLEEEEYEYVIRCVDLGGNADTWQVNFSVESDSDAPVVARAYKEENYLKITTDENATCVYDTASCNYLFEDGLPMTAGTERNNHFVDWSTKTKFYIKCKDDFGNQPVTDKCSAIVRPI